MQRNLNFIDLIKKYKYVNMLPAIAAQKKYDRKLNFRFLGSTIFFRFSLTITVDMAYGAFINLKKFNFYLLYLIEFTTVIGKDRKNASIPSDFIIFLAHSMHLFDPDNCILCLITIY